jgi:hypothetical protein
MWAIGYLAVRVDERVEPQVPVSKTSGARTLTTGDMSLTEPTPPLMRDDGEDMPFAGYALEFVSAAVFELEP